MAFKLLILTFLFLLYSRPYHDFYISICYIKMVDEKLQVNYRVFKNDAEVALSSNESENPGFCADLGKYILSHFQIQEDENPLDLQLVGCTSEGSGNLETINCQLIAKNHKNISEKLEINSTVLLDSFDDQVNMIHVQLGDVKKSMNLDRDRHSFSIELK